VRSGRFILFIELNIIFKDRKTENPISRCGLKAIFLGFELIALIFGHNSQLRTFEQAGCRIISEGSLTLSVASFSTHNFTFDENSFKAVHSEVPVSHELI